MRISAWPRRSGVTLAVLLAVAWPAAASNSGVKGEPDQIQSASLTQDGQQLVWRVRLTHPFDASRLAREHRSLCLLIERVRARTVWEEACLLGPARGSRGDRIQFMAVSNGKAGPGNLIAATVTRPSPGELVASFLPAALNLPYRSLRWQTASTVGPPACTRGARCSDLYPAQPTLLKLHEPVLVGCEASGPSLVYQGSGHEREIALTFDDGPWTDPPTVDFLRVLEREHVPATFFLIGDQIAKYDPSGALERRMLRDGDMIGDHSWSHPNVATLSAKKQRMQLTRAADAIQHATHGFMPCLWRPPYGAISRSLVSLARSLGLLTIMWNVDPRDWALPGVKAIDSNVLAHTRDGAIVIQHVGGGPRAETLAALPQEINALRAKGYTLVTVTQLLGLRLVYR